MQKQLRAGEDDPFGSSLAQEQIKVKPLDIPIPDVHEVMKMSGAVDVDLDAERKKRPRNKRVSRICCCGSPGCGIGPMTIVTEEDA